MNQENAFPLGATPDEDAHSIVIELETHDMSRFEWRVHRGIIAPQPELAAAGVRHVRQLFRYDLTPLCPRLHDPIKRRHGPARLRFVRSHRPAFPVLDAGSGRAKFIGAPRRYQMPIRVLAATFGDRRELNASLVLDKQDIVRIEHHAKRD